MCDLTSPSHELGTSPTTLGYSRDVALERQLAEAQPAQRELPHVGARTAAQMAAVAQANLELRLLLFFGDLRGGCHNSSAPSQLLSAARNGMPTNCNSFRASSSVFADVTTHTFMPRALSTFM